MPQIVLDAIQEYNEYNCMCLEHLYDTTSADFDQITYDEGEVDDYEKM